MRRIQKIAMFIFVVLTLAMLLSAGAIGVLYLKYGFPKAWAALGFMGLSGLAGLAPLIFRKDSERVECDERDREIQRKAALVAFAMAYLVVGLATMVPFTVLGPDRTIGIHWLPMIFGAAGITHFYTWSIAILTQYGWRRIKD